jgi:UDP-N-acetylglucosamine--N-acetylmuramyl-(pentapeptide) pyrophosphoryl-undecaprenol N-acetylglucosamine transferase
LPAHERPQVVHQSGERHLEALRASYSAAGRSKASWSRSSTTWRRRYAEADLVICRAGAITGRGALHGRNGERARAVSRTQVDDHQSAKRGLPRRPRARPVLLPQPQLAPGTLAALLRRMDRKTLLEMARKARALGKPEAARTVAERCMELAR